MATYEYNKNLKFLLPSGFKCLTETDDEGNENFRITAGDYKDDEGEIVHRFNCKIVFVEYEFTDEIEDRKTAAKKVLENVSDGFKNCKKIKLPGNPEAYIISKAMPVSLLGRTIKKFVLVLLILTSETSIAQMISTGNIYEDEPEEELEVYKYMFEVMKAVRVDGKKLNLDGITPQKMKKTLKPVFDESEEALDVTPTIRFVFNDGSEETTFEMKNFDGKLKDVTKRLTEVTPDESLYPHYKSINSMSIFSLLGGSVNSTGTEYAFYPLSTANEDDDNVDVYKRIIAKDKDT